MIRVYVLYPNKPGATFDHKYYAETHAPMVVSKLKPLGLVEIGIEKGLAGGTPASPAPYVAMGYLKFSSMEEFQKAFGAHAKEIMGDMPNYTDVEPLIQISEVVV